MALRGVIFDLGNTLMYFDGDWEVVTRQGIDNLLGSLRARGITVGAGFEKDFISARREGRELSARTDVEYTASRALRETLARYGHDNPPADVIRQALKAFFKPEQERWLAYPDSVDTVKRLRSRGLTVGLISNATDDEFVQDEVRRGGLARYIDPVISSAALPWRKPDPRIFDHLLDLWGLSPSEVVMVGDWPSTDVLGAHRAGMKAVLVDERWPAPPHLHAHIPDEHLLAPDAVVRELSELLPAIVKLNGNLH